MKTLRTLVVASSFVAAPALAVDCDDLYYGIGRAPDLKAAYACYEHEKDAEMQIVLLLNGDGVPVDVKKARALYDALVKEAGDHVSLQLDALGKLIDSPQRKRIDYCEDVAGDTIAMNECEHLNQKIAQAKAEAELKDLRAKLPEPTRARLAAVEQAFAKLVEAEGTRAYQLYIDGSIRNVAAMGQQSAVRANYLKLLRETVAARGLKPESLAALKSADDELNVVYKESLAEYAKGYSEYLKDPQFKDSWATYRGYVDSFKKASKEAQIAWIAYRDRTAELLAAVYKDEKAFKGDALVSAKTAVTRIRTEELGTDPLGPN